MDGQAAPAGSRVEMVMATIRQRIAGRSLTPGARLPSIRQQAAALKVSASTVVEAYERLAAEGAIRSRPGSGFYVAAQAAALSLAEVGPKVDRAIDPFWVSRQSLESGDATLTRGCGWLPALRQLLSRRMSDKSVACPPEQIMLTESGTQALDLVCRLLLEPGDTVLVDDPCYFNFQALLRAHRAKIVGVPWTANGPDIELFGAALSEHRPRLYITNSAIQNPTGAVLTPVTAHRVLKLAEQSGLTIVEDDLFGDFERIPAPRLAAFDGLDRVILIGSFSKTISASVRCGYVAARREWIDGLIDLKIATSFGGGRFAAELALAVLGDGGYRRHLEALRVRLAGAMATVVGKLKAIGIEPWLMPEAGMLLWCRLPDGIDAADLARAAVAEGVVLAPGNVFSVSQSATNFMRFNVSQALDDRVFDALRRSLAQARRPA